MRLSPMVRQSLSSICILISALASTASAQNGKPQQMDEEFARSVKEWTTRAEFISPLVDHLPKVAGVPSPREILGYHIGTPKKLTYTSEIYRYYRALAAASERVKVMTIGKTDEGRECLIVIVANEETIKNIETYRGYLAQLADPRKINETAAQEII